MISTQRLFGHFFAVLFSVTLVLTVSLQLEVYIQSSSIGESMIAVSIVHSCIVYVALNVRTNSDLDVRLNPFVSIFEWVFNRYSSPNNYLILTVELIAQSTGALMASLLFAGTAPTSFTIVSSIVKSPGWTLIMEIIGSFSFSWIYFHNYYDKESVNLAFTVACALGVFSGILFPYHGVSTFNPLRTLAKCIPTSTCAISTYEYILYLGPFLGILLGYCGSIVSRQNTRKIK